MAEFFNVPDKYNGLTLKQIRDKTGAAFRPDILAGFLGINENTPLSAGQTFSTAGFPSSYIGTSGEYQGLKSIFNAGSSNSNYADEIIDPIQQLIDEQTAYAEELFGEGNPFVFDEYMAQQQAEEQFEPYYSEMLNDYLDNIGVKRESLTGDQNLLNALQTTSEGQAGEASRAYERAVNEANQGFAGRGMFFSGTRKRALGRGEVERKEDVQQTAEGIRKTQRDIFGGDVEHGGIAGYGAQGAFGESVASEVGKIKQEKAKEWYTPLIQSYYRKYPTSNNVLAGYSIPDYLQY